MKCTAIVLAAGQGKRMKSSVQKQFLQLGDYPVLYYSMKAFQDAPQITDIILVTGEQEIAYCQETFVERYQIDKVSAVVAGGKERYNSVYQGLCACQGTDYVLIHDGARPFVTEELIERGIDCAKTYKACAAGMPSKDTVKIVENDQKWHPRRIEAGCGMSRRPRSFSMRWSKKHTNRHYLMTAAELPMMPW